MELWVLYFSCAVVITKFSPVNAITGKVMTGQIGGQPVKSITLNQNVGTGSIPVYITAPEDVQNTGVYPTNVAVNCEISQKLPAKSEVTFTSITLVPATSLSGSVAFSVTKPGRAADVKCFVESSSASLPQTTVTFTKETSMSAVFGITILQAPKVSICYADFVSVPKMFNSNESTFEVQVSEVVKDQNVTISCSQLTPGTDVLALTIPAALMTVGNKKTLMSYTIVKSGTETSVQCNAVSTAPGLQFKKDTSQSETKKFVQLDGKAEMFPDFSANPVLKQKVALVLDNPIAGGGLEVNFQCHLILVDSVTKGNDVRKKANEYCYTSNGTPVQPTKSTTPGPAITTVSAATTVSTTPITKPSESQNASIWKLSPSSFQFKEGEKHKTFEVERMSPPASAVMEIVVVVCCAPSDNNQSPRFVNTTSSVMLVLNLDGTKQVNVSLAPASTDDLKETALVNPAFVDVSPCPCDLTENMCDTSCCCDKLCSNAEKETFSCYKSLYGGQAGDVGEYKCDASNMYTREDYQPFMCIWRETNAWLGYFYSHVNKLKPALFSAEIAKSTSTRWGLASEVTPTEKVSTYKYGVEITTAIYDTNDAVISRGVLSLPQKSLDGACMSDVPLQFLVNKESICIMDITQAMCENPASKFNVLLYAQSTFSNNPSCPTPLRIMSEYNGASIIPVETNYYCATSLSGFVMDLTSQAVPNNQHSLFRSDKVFNCSYNENAKFSCLGVTNFPQDVSGETSTQFPRCPFDSGYNSPSSPTWDDTSKICKNAVLSVKYSFQWNGTNLMKLSADYVLGDIPLKPGSQSALLTSSLNQKFATRFVHVSSNSTLIPQRKSGVKGYDIGKPLIAAVSLNDGNAINSLNLLKPQVDGLCAKATLTSIPFAMSATSGCALNLNSEDFDNCDNLREIVLSNLNLVMPADFVALVGDPDINRESNWVKIFREDLSKLNLTIFNAPPTFAPPTTTTTKTTTTIDPGLYARYIPLDRAKGLCRNITSGIHLTVQYARNGENNGRGIFSVIGANINYTSSDWELTCSGADSPNCINKSSSIQTFYLTSSVTFSKIKGTIPNPPTSYHVASVYSEICWWDICDGDVLFPLLPGFQGNSREYSLAMFLFLTFIVFWITVFVSCPLKSIH